MTIRESFRGHLEAAGLSRRTCSLYWRSVWHMAWEERLRPDEAWARRVTPAKVRRWVGGAAGLGTQRLRLSASRAFFGWAVSAGIRRSNPAAGVSVVTEGPRRRRV